MENHLLSKTVGVFYMQNKGKASLRKLHLYLMTKNNENIHILPYCKQFVTIMYKIFIYKVE